MPQAIPTRPCRFTVLHHTGIDEPHYDFMFETSPTSQLTTFRLRSWPIFSNEPAIRLRDHRRAYLDYVGPVSADRGRVDRVDEGRLIVTQVTEWWVLNHEDGRPFARIEPVWGGEPADWMFVPVC